MRVKAKTHKDVRNADLVHAVKKRTWASYQKPICKRRFGVANGANES